MSSIEKLSKIIASRISTNLSIDNDHEEVLAYGAFAFLQMVVSIFMVVVFGAIFNVLLEIMVISFSAAALRKYSGGAHATTPMSCAISGMIVFGVLSFLVKYLIIKVDFIYILLALFSAFIFVFYVMYKYSPVGSVNKPLKKETTRSRLKKQSMECVLLLLIVDVILTSIYFQTKSYYLQLVAVCISVGIVWQSITLVSLGHYIIDKLDKFLKDTNKLIRRTN